jgi:hypothetical protein
VGRKSESSSSGGKMYTTSVTLDSSSAIVNVYRKGRVHDPTLQAVGLECDVFNSAFGICVVLI